MKYLYSVLVSLILVVSFFDAARATDLVWNCTYSNGRVCKTFNELGYEMGSMSVDGWVNGKLIDRQNQADNAVLMAQYANDIATNFTDAIANLTAATWESYNTTIAYDAECNASFDFRNMMLLRMQSWGANVTEEDLFAKDPNAVRASYANGYGGR